MKDGYETYFTEAVKDAYANRSDFLLNELRKNVKRLSNDTTFASTSSNPLDRRLDFCAYFLALIKTLDDQGESFETIRQLCLNIVMEYVRPTNKIQLFLKRIPAKLTHTWLATLFLSAFNKKISRKTHPDGFRAEIITDKKETFGLGYGFDIVECGICKLFKKHSYEQYASILCEVDELTTQLAGLKLIRTGTIALGAKKCDFRFKKRISGRNSNESVPITMWFIDCSVNARFDGFYTGISKITFVPQASPSLSTKSTI